MDDTINWSISWTIDLLPPQEMLPSNTISGNIVHNIFCIPSEHLFGFSPCVLQLDEDERITIQKVRDTPDGNGLYTRYEDFSALFALEELAAFV